MKNIWKTWWIYVVIVAVVVTGVVGGVALLGGDKPSSASTVSKYEINAYKPQSELDRIKYSYSFDGYDFYYIYLGEMANVPVYYDDAIRHNGDSSWEYTFSITAGETTTKTNSISESCSRTKTETDTHTESTTEGNKLSNEISTKLSASVKGKIFLGIEATAGYESTIRSGGEETFQEYIADANTTGFQKTKSLTDTYTETYTRTTTQTITKKFSVAKSDRIGFYRYTYFSTADVYLYVIKDSSDDGIVFFDYQANVIPDLYYWEFDYSETASFKKSDATKFVLDTSILDNLPDPELKLYAPPVAPLVVSHPQNASALQGGDASFTVVASGRPLSYQWQVSAGGGWSDLTNNGVFSDVNTPTLEISNAPITYNGYKFQCAISNPLGNVISNEAILTVNSQLAITSQPQDQKITGGGDAVFSITADGIGPLSYQWQVSTDGGSTYNDVSDDVNTSGATTNTLNLQNVPLGYDGYLYHCVVIGMITLISNPAVLTVDATATPMVVAGVDCTVAIKSDGTVWAWGYNNYGQLGNNSTTDSSTPVQVKGAGGSGYLTDVISISAGYGHTVALKSDGTVWTWGLNYYYGQLGNNSTTTSTTPVQVLGGATGDTYLKLF